MTENRAHLHEIATLYGVFQDENLLLRFAERMPDSARAEIRRLSRDSIVDAFDEVRLGRYRASGPVVAIANLWMLRDCLLGAFHPWDSGPGVPAWVVEAARSLRDDEHDPDYFEAIDALPGSSILELWQIGKRLNTGERRDHFFDVAYSDSSDASLLIRFGRLLNTADDYVIGAAGRSLVPDKITTLYYRALDQLSEQMNLVDVHAPWERSGPSETRSSGAAVAPTRDAVLDCVREPLLTHADAVRSDRRLCNLMLELDEQPLLDLLWPRHVMIALEAELVVGADINAALSVPAIRQAAKQCLMFNVD